MNNLQKRFLLFIFGCILVRIIFVIIAKYINIKYLPILGYIGLIISFGFLFIYFMNLRKSGLEVFGDKIWWNNLRPIHGILYGLFAFNAIIYNKNSWIYLLIDVIIGLLAFLNYHYMTGNLDKIFIFNK
jgi:hypothetical protein